MPDEQQDKAKLQSLTLQGTSEIGKQIIDAAITKTHDKAKEQVLNFATDLMEQIELLDDELSHLKGDLAAIQAGEFKINKQGCLIYNSPERGKKHIYGKRR